MTVFILYIKTTKRNGTTRILRGSFNGVYSGKRKKNSNYVGKIWIRGDTPSRKLSKYWIQNLTFHIEKTCPFTITYLNRDKIYEKNETLDIFTSRNAFKNFTCLRSSLGYVLKLLFHETEQWKYTNNYRRFKWYANVFVNYYGFTCIIQLKGSVNICIPTKCHQNL